MAYLRARGVKGYVALNVLVRCSVRCSVRWRALACAAALPLWPASLQARSRRVGG